jgi:hypothetical protein
VAVFVKKTVYQKITLAQQSISSFGHADKKTAAAVHKTGPINTHTHTHTQQGSVSIGMKRVVALHQETVTKLCSHNTIQPFRLRMLTKIQQRLFTKITKIHSHNTTNIFV